MLWRFESQVTMCETFDLTSEQTESEWAGCDGRLATALGCVLEWLSGRELACAGAVSRQWRRAAALPRLWRRLLVTECGAAPQAIRALTLYNAGLETEIEDDLDGVLEWSWRDEYVRAVAGWRYVCSLHPLAPPPEPRGGRGERGEWGAVLLHAALAPAGDALAVAAEDASITVFVRTGSTADAWTVSWHMSLCRRGWRAAARVEWAPAGGGRDEGRRLLAAGPLLLAERWELLVLELGAGCSDACVLARAGGSAGAPACWASHDAFLSLELRLLAPHRGVTTVWLNSATQKEHSEFAGVAAPVLRIYNEAQAHISLVAVVEVPTETNVSKFSPLNTDSQYIHATLSKTQMTKCSTRRLLIAACGHAGGVAGQATALGSWELRAGVPAQLAAERGGLAERVARRRHAPRVAEPDPPPPTEADLRSLCSPPEALCPLRDRLLGLTPHPSCQCVWAMDAAGRATCVALPSLTAVRVLEPSDARPALVPHYVQSTVSHQFIASPTGDDRGRVAVWSARSGARCAAPPPSPAPAPAAALLPAATPAQLLVLAGNAVLRTMAMRRLSDVPPRDSCEPIAAPPCPPCEPPPRPQCRARAPPRTLALRLTCCPPPRGLRPPCAPHLPTCSLDCSQAKPRKECPTSTPAVLECDAGHDRVAARLLASKEARRWKYMREVQERCPPAPPYDPPYRLPTERECCRATDGRQYTIAPTPPSEPAFATVSRACGPCREPPPPKCVELVPDNKCKIRGPDQIDPCAHCPRVIMNIDRSKPHDSCSDRKKSATCETTPTRPDCSSYSERFTSQNTKPPPKCVVLVPDNECKIRGPDQIDPCAHCPRAIMNIDRSKPHDSCSDRKKSATCETTPTRPDCSSYSERFTSQNTKPPPKCVELVPDNECKIRGSDQIDPCAHCPRVIMNIDRSKPHDSCSDRKKSATCETTPTRPDCSSYSERFTAQITKPPPKCVELVPDNECKIRGPDQIDPCAHCPRVIMNIDRSKPHDSCSDRKKSATCESNPTRPDRPCNSEGFTSRIMKSFNFGRSGGESSPKCAPCVAGEKGSSGGKAQYAGDSGWCDSIQPAAAAPRCRPLTQAEKLHQRACRDIPCGERPPNTRKLHTAAPLFSKFAPKDMKSAAAQTKANAERLEKMLNNRAQFKESAKGRVVECAPSIPLTTAGGLELPVPPGASAVHVKVSLDPAKIASALNSTTPPPDTCGTVKVSPCEARAAAAACGASPPPPTSAPPHLSRAVPTGDEGKSWLSIKTLQKKIAETCRKADTPNRGTFTDPCQPKPKPSPSPSEPKNKDPCSPPKAPSKKIDCNTTKKEPTRFIPTLSTIA